MFTEQFIRDTVLPAVQATGGATVLTSPYGMPPSLLVMDKYQPPTWVVGMGVEPIYVAPSLADSEGTIAVAANMALDSVGLNSWSAIGFWVDGEGMLCIEPVETFTNHHMAITAGRERGQDAIYAMHRGELEWLPREAQVHPTPADV